MNLISPTGVEVNIGDTLQPDEYIGMCRREIMDKFLRDRAIEKGAGIVNGLVTSINVPVDHKTSESQYTINYQEYTEGSSAGTAKSMNVDYIVGADGANSRVAKAMDAGSYNFAIAFQERIKISDEKMKFYEEMAEMYVGDDVSPDFYGWVFPKYDHVGVGTGTVVNRPASVTALEIKLQEERSSRLKLTPSLSTTAPVVSRDVSPLSEMLLVT